MINNVAIRFVYRPAEVVYFGNLKIETRTESTFDYHSADLKKIKKYVRKNAHRGETVISSVYLRVSDITDVSGYFGIPPQVYRPRY